MLAPRGVSLAEGSEVIDLAHGTHFVEVDEARPGSIDIANALITCVSIVKNGEKEPLKRWQ